MRLKNYNEDLVFEAVKIVLSEREDVKPTRPFFLDVAAYTLNRIPPKYITSERGFNRQFVRDPAENGEKAAGLVDVIELITLVNRAVDVVSSRRREIAAFPRRGGQVRQKMDDLSFTYFYNLPHIFGRIVDASSERPVVEAEATLFINDKFAVPAEPGWANPYRTNEQTSGYFSFWPRAEMGNTDWLAVDVRIGLNHGEYRPFTFRKKMKVPGEFFVNDSIRGDKLLDVGTLTLERA